MIARQLHLIKNNLLVLIKYYILKKSSNKSFDHTNMIF